MVASQIENHDPVSVLFGTSFETFFFLWELNFGIDFPKIPGLISKYSVRLADETK